MLCTWRDHLVRSMIYTKKKAEAVGRRIVLLLSQCFITKERLSIKKKQQQQQKQTNLAAKDVSRMMKNKGTCCHVLKHTGSHIWQLYS